MGGRQFTEDRYAKAFHHRTDNTYTPNNAGLAGTCRQIPAETDQQIASLEPRKVLHYELQIMVCDERAFLPTWTCLPVPKLHIDILRVSVRLS